MMPYGDKRYTTIPFYDKCRNGILYKYTAVLLYKPKTIKTEKGEQIMKTTIKWFLKFASEYDYMCSQPWVEHPNMQQK